MKNLKWLLKRVAHATFEKRRNIVNLEHGRGASSLNSTLPKKDVNFRAMAMQETVTSY